VHDTEQQYLFCEYERVFDHIFVLRYVIYKCFERKLQNKTNRDFPEEVSFSYVTFISWILQ